MLGKAYILTRAALKPSRGPIMLKKAVKRITDREKPGHRQQNIAWIRAHCRDFAEEAKATDPDLWQEALRKSSALRARAQDALAAAGVDLGGGGYYPMLYFVTRRRKPQVIVETGVAAGYSSQIFLEALEANGGDGRLYSSDFPYFRLRDPERFIGLLVEPRLRDRWTLYIDGDEKNLPRILDQVSQVDFFHYDSDKSISGRQFAMSRVLPEMSMDGLVVMDDIQDNTFFQDTVRGRQPESFRIYQFEGKYIGVLIGIDHPGS
jgi:predicted O-methyltransferase YrrM